MPNDYLEQQRRDAILREIEQRMAENGPHVAQPNPKRARQFMPFAALKGYHEMAYERERKEARKYDAPCEPPDDLIS